jgi:polar amino acid transport system substrate-binding protein
MSFQFSTVTLAEEITLAADAWCPINCKENDKKPGIALEIAEHAFAKENITITYRVMPWNRTLEATRLGEVDGAIGAYKADAPDFVYPEESIVVAREGIYTRSDSKLTYSGVASFKDLKVGIIKDYSYAEEFDTYIKAHPKKFSPSFGDNALRANIKKLLEGRIDALIEVDVVFSYTTNAMKNENLFKLIGSSEKTSPLYIAFSPEPKKAQRSRELAKILDRGIGKLRARGKLAMIYKKYGLKDQRD